MPLLLAAPHIGDVVARVHGAASVHEDALQVIPGGGRVRDAEMWVGQGTGGGGRQIGVHLHLRIVSEVDWCRAAKEGLSQGSPGLNNVIPGL